MARIMIVDDSIVMRRNLEKMLMEAGHEVVGQAINGMQAVIMYSEVNPDLVTMDISMPIMSGVDAVSYIINKDPDANIIMLSAINQKQMVFQAVNNGAKHYVIKPIVKEVLLRTIDEVLKDSEALKTLPAKDHELGFNVVNENGIFNFVFNSNLSLRDIVPMQTAISSLLFVTPLHVVFDFNSQEHINERVLVSIIKIGEKVKAANGVLEYTAQSQELLDRISEEREK